MTYYCDFEALEFDNVAALKEKIYPYYLNPDKLDSDGNKITKSLCPIMFSACDSKGVLKVKQNIYNQPVSFLKFIDSIIPKHNRSEHKILWSWFHNVQYDFRIIIHELFYHDFTNIVDSDKITYIGEYQTEKDRAFAIVGESLSKYIGINLYYRGFKILIRDTMSILNSAQDKILSDFGYPKKVNVNWQSISIEQLQSKMSLIEERNIYDVTSLAKCIEQFKTTFYERFHGKGSTAASMSLDALKHYLCERAGIENINHESKNDYFRSQYPQLNGTFADLSKACYSGGICTLNRKYQGKEQYNIQMVDIHNSYGYALTQPLPYGEGRQISDFTEQGYSEYVVYISFEMRGQPFQRCHAENKARAIIGMEQLDVEYTFTRSQFPDKFTGYLPINSIDLQTITKYAKIKKLSFVYGVNYKVNTIIRDFILPLYVERKISKGVLNLAIKLILNALYGKFAQDLSGIIFQYTDIDEYVKVRAIDNDTIYKPLASAVTAYARRNWVETVYILGDDFLYGDTDSAYFKNIKLSILKLQRAGKLGDNIGQWGFDKGYGDYIVRGKFLSKKNYVLELPESRNKKKYPLKIKVTCVGLSLKYHNQITFDNFVINSEPFEVYKMVNVYGGKAMRKGPYKIKERNYY